MKTRMLKYTKSDLSIIIPVYNEERILKKNILAQYDYIKKCDRINRFELIIIDNGSSDETAGIAISLSKLIPSIIKSSSLKDRGIGIALNSGIKISRYPLIYFNAIDNPFRFEDLENFLTLVNEFDIAFASKNHPDSVYQGPLVRKLLSKMFMITIKILFHLPLTDTQGTFMAKKKKLLPILSLCTASNAFFQTQLAIYSCHHRLRVSEIPVRYIAGRGRKSKYRLFAEGVNLLRTLISERMKI